MALYLLDKNVVEDIKKSLNGTKADGIALARAIDYKRNTARRRHRAGRLRLARSGAGSLSHLPRPTGHPKNRDDRPNFRDDVGCQL